MMYPRGARWWGSRRFGVTGVAAYLLVGNPVMSGAGVAMGVGLAIGARQLVSFRQGTYSARFIEVPQVGPVAVSTIQLTVLAGTNQVQVTARELV